MPVRVFDSSNPLAASVLTASRITERLTPYSRSGPPLGKGLVGSEVAAYDADAELLHDLGEKVAFSGRADTEQGGGSIVHR